MIVREFRNRRHVIQLGILVPMIALAIVSSDLFTGLVGIMLIPAAGFQWAVYFYLRSKLSLAIDLGYQLPTLADRVEDKLTLAEAQTGGAIAGVLVVLRGFQFIEPVPRWVFLVIISYVMLMLMVPALGDLQRWRNVWLPALRRHPPTAQHRRADDEVPE